MVDHRIGLGEYLALLPYHSGHELGDDYVVVGALGTDNRTIATAAIEWVFPFTDEGAARHCAQHLARALRGQDVGHLMVVGYGPAGPERSRLIATELRDALDAATVQVHIQDGTWRTRAGLAGPWGVATALPRLAGPGRPDPAATKDELRASMAPLPWPVFGSPSPATIAGLEKLSPALRADVARRTLDNVAARNDRVTQMQLLAHLATSDLVTRDIILGHALDGTDTEARVKALVQTFRSAPAENRPALAALAAAATYLAAWNPPQVRELLAHADSHSTLAGLVSTAVDAGVNPHKLRSTLLRAVSIELDEAEQAGTANDRTRPDVPGTSKVQRKPAAPPAPARPAPTARKSAPEL